ncbi:hypothetical protein SAMN05216268_101343 [Streptomyces yunnanensis]|uniref:Uncharacterized protein n=1 Tax=Streptomyces yunnanensis TaxID=156453 RepID=A0A9X8MJF5_9ACTN|nr:hypothetical protein SAMN05216268_101343 [Streptomyces yunnanensis]
MLLEFVLFSLMDTVFWIGGKSLDRARSARRIAAFRRGERITLRCRFRIRAQGPAMHRGRIVVSASGVVLDGPGPRALALSGPAAAATGGGGFGTALDCTVTAEDGSAKKIELLVSTWDAKLVELITEHLSEPV